MNILIIGNGFDLAHGLPTRYTDFLDNTEKLLPHLDGKAIDCKVGRCIAKKLTEEALFDEFLQITKNFWYLFFADKYVDREKDRTWIDFENEIQTEIRALEKDSIENGGKTSTRSFVKVHPYLQDGLIKYLGDSSGIKTYPGTLHSAYLFADFLYVHLEDFIRAFEIYCVCVINKSVEDYVEAFRRHSTIRERYSYMRKTDFTNVLSFNYTNTYESLYWDKHSSKMCYIHGAAQSEPGKTNMILGIDETLSKEQNESEFTFVRFKKYFQRITRETSSEYKNWIKQIKESGKGESHEVRILGHSLDYTDHEIFKEFFAICPTENKINITIYYHDDLSKNRLIENTIRIIGKEELIRRVHGTNPSIRFYNQYDKVNGIIRNHNEMKYKIWDFT